MEPHAGYSIATREVAGGVTAPAKQQMNVYACTQKKMHYWKQAENVSETAQYSTAIRLSPLPVQSFPPLILTGQMSVPEMHDQNYSNGRKRSGV